jgi:hypothetical protein
MSPGDVAFFRTFGFLVLRAHFSPLALEREMERALDKSSQPPLPTGVASVRYVPMMTGGTPQSLALLDVLEPIAAELLDAPVLPVRAKGMRYYGMTRWHCDSTSSVPSIGFAAYLEPLTKDDGALRVLAGSHRREYGDAIAQFFAASEDLAVASLPAFALATLPGDVIAFDERVWHASVGGTERLQWRVDYVRAPRTKADEEGVRAYFAQIFAPEWDGGYDPDAAPSYDANWLGSDRPAVEILRRLGVFELASAQEAIMRSKRRSRSDV